jgi:thiamine biosynthesis lipoprotein
MENIGTEQTGQSALKPLRQAPATLSTNSSAVRYEASHQAMGTFFSIVAYGSSTACLEEATSEAFQVIDRLDQQMSHYKPDSELCAINRMAHGEKVAVTPELFGLLEDSIRYSEETNGAFDITVGPLMKSWGFFRGWGRRPSPAELAEALQKIGYRHIKLDAATQTVKFDRPGIELDLGAIGKGYAVDRVVEVLRSAGIGQALISSGTSSIFALGAPPGEEGWKVSLCHPLDRTKSACVLQLHNLSLSVSGEYEKSFELEGRIYSHIIDPRSGEPLENMLMTVVIAPFNTQSDALSTSFFVAGIKQSHAYLEQHPDLTAIIYVRSTDATHTVEQIVLKSDVTTLAEDQFIRL